MNILSPIVLFVYNRPWHTAQTINALKKNILSSESELFIFSDQAQSYADKEGVNLVREMIDKVTGFKRVTIIKHNNNMGLSRSIIYGVSMVIKKFGKVIVLEDDLLTSKFFLTFMNDGLQLYKENLNIWEIGGYVYPIEHSIKNDFFFAPYTTSWGWATWKDRWKYFKKDPERLFKEFDRKMIKKFDLNYSDNLWGQVVANKNNKIDTWAVFWYAEVFLHNGLVLYPVKSMVENIGHDGSGINCKKSLSYSVSLDDKYKSLYLVEPVIDKEMFLKVQKYLIGAQFFLKRVVFFLKRVFS